jgi:hypothetical protein
MVEPRKRQAADPGMGSALRVEPRRKEAIMKAKSGVKSGIGASYEDNG